jgi:phage gp29-like protein
MALPDLVAAAKPSRSLSADVYPRTVQLRSLWRRYYGHGLDLIAIEQATKSAEVGLMADITDLESESRGIDPNMASAMSKRAGILARAPANLVPARGPDVDKAKAALAVEAMHAALAKIPYLRLRLRSLAWALFYGRGALELHWEPLAVPLGTAPFQLKWLPTEVRPIPKRNLSFGTQRELRLVDPNYLQGMFANDGVALDDYPAKFLTWLPELFGELPEREGLGPPCMYWSFFKRFDWRMRMKLTELVGIPWRIVTAKGGAEANVSPDQLKAAFNAASALGAETTAQFDPGIELDVEFPGENTGALFHMNSEDIDKQINKLILWTSGTMDASPTGLGSSTTTELRNEQLSMHQGDCEEFAEVLTHQLITYLALVNWGPEATALYKPKLELDAQKPRDRKTELDIVGKAVSMGVKVAVDEARSIAGLRAPEEDEEVIQRAAPVAGAPGDLSQPTGQKDDGTTDDAADDPTAPGNDPEEDTVQAARMALDDDEHVDLVQHLMAAEGCDRPRAERIAGHVQAQLDARGLADGR